MTARKQTAAAKEPSAAELEIVALLGRVGTNASVGDWSNGNGTVVCATATRADGRVVRFYCEGTAGAEAGVVAVLAGIKALTGGGK